MLPISLRIYWWRLRLRRQILAMNPLKPFREAYYRWTKKTSYRIENTAEGQTITCLICRRTSYNAGDVQHLYCAFCHRWHS